MIAPQRSSLTAKLLTKRGRVVTQRSRAQLAEAVCQRKAGAETTEKARAKDSMARADAKPKKARSKAGYLERLELLAQEDPEVLVLEGVRARDWWEWHGQRWPVG